VPDLPNRSKRTAQDSEQPREIQHTTGGKNFVIVTTGPEHEDGDGEGGGGQRNRKWTQDDWWRGW
jgi:hypothetical protein